MIYSLIARRIEDVARGGFATGVTRFDQYLRRVFPDLKSVTQLPPTTPDDVVITDNHLSVSVPRETPCIVVHHGCAAAHWDTDPAWRNANTRRMVDEQRRMFDLPNRTFVAPSSWVRDQFAERHNLPPDYARLIINWVPVIERKPVKRYAPIILGDWRDTNKGSLIWPSISSLLPEYEFERLSCRTDEERLAAYRRADAYLCLSRSEGGAYAVSDAEAASLPIVSTDVGNAKDFGAWIAALDPQEMAGTLRVALRYGRVSESYYAGYTFDRWAELWRGVVDDARSGRADQPGNGSGRGDRRGGYAVAAPQEGLSAGDRAQGRGGEERSGQDRP